MTDNIFDQESERRIFGEQQKIQERMSGVAAANRAYGEVFVNNDPQGYEQRKQRNLQTTVKDASIELVQRSMMEQDIEGFGALSPEALSALSPEEQVQTISRQIERLDYRKVKALDFALLQTFLQGGGDVKLETFEKFSRQLSPHQLERRIAFMQAKQRRKAEAEVMATVAQQGWDNNYQAVGEILLQDLTPIFPLLSRWNVLDGLTEAAGVPLQKGWRGFFLGEQRQNLREGLVDMSCCDTTTHWLL